jgi:hypothetical protein
LLTAILITLAMAGSGCDDITKPGDRPSKTAKNTLTWDLSHGHTVKDVRWPNRLDAFELNGGVRVAITFPGGKTLAERFEKAMGLREGDVIRTLDLFYPATTTDEAYQQAKVLGRQWDIDLGNIDTWHRRRLGQRKAGKEDYGDTAFTGGPASEPLGGPGGPAPIIEVMNSFSASRPVVVNLSFHWSRQG